jgi:hypothetical protein
VDVDGRPWSLWNTRLRCLRKYLPLACTAASGGNKVDIFSVGVTLLRYVSGTEPFMAKNIELIAANKGVEFAEAGVVLISVEARFGKENDAPDPAIAVWMPGAAWRIPGCV